MISSYKIQYLPKIKDISRSSIVGILLRRSNLFVGTPFHNFAWLQRSHLSAFNFYSKKASAVLRSQSTITRNRIGLITMQSFVGLQNLFEIIGGSSGANYATVSFFYKQVAPPEQIQFSIFNYQLSIDNGLPTATKYFFGLSHT